MTKPNMPNDAEIKEAVKNHHPFCSHRYEESKKSPRTDWRCECALLNHYDSFRHGLEIPKAGLQEVDTLELAIMFHHTYEKLAPNLGYDTKKETRIFDPESANGKLMLAVCEEIKKQYYIPKAGLPTEEEIAKIYHNFIISEFLHAEKDVHVDKKIFVANLIDRKKELAHAIHTRLEEGA